MLDISFVHPSFDKQPKRIRAIHTKVKTGCNTCKIRRKKCDELKPFCNRCTSTGRRCDGYGEIKRKSKARKPSTSRPLLPKNPPQSNPKSSTLFTPSHVRTSNSCLRLWKHPNLGCLRAETDCYCFDFFRYRTGPAFTAYFSSSIWRTFMVRACFLHPTVLQAAAAVGAVHRRFELGISAEAFRFCDIAVTQYRKTLQCLDQDLRSGHPLSSELSMVVSIFLCMYETFQGNYDDAVKHFKSGLTKLCGRHKNRTHSETYRKTRNISYDHLHDFTYALEERAPKLFGSPTNVLPNVSVSNQLDPIPEVFFSLEQARDVIVTEGQHIWHAWSQLELGNIKDFSTQYLHVSRLLEWSKAFADYAKLEQGRFCPASRQPYLLKMYREAMYLVIMTQLASYKPNGQLIMPPCQLPEACCNSHPVCYTYASRQSALNAHFARLQFLGEFFLDEQSNFTYDNYSICVDSGIGPPLCLNGSEKSGSTKLRYQATSVLGRSGHLQEKVWSKLGVYNVAEKLGSIEEHAVTEAVRIPGVLEPKWVDVTGFLDEGKTLLRYCREDEFGGLVWTQEWITH